MKKILILLVAALCIGVVADAGQRTIITDLGATEVIADNAIDTLAVVSFDDRLVWQIDEDAATGDGAPAAYVFVTFTAAGMDSFSVFLDYYLDEQATTHLITTTNFVARTSGTGYVLICDPGIPVGAGALRVRLSNADITGGAATTNLDAYLVQVVWDD